jgi:hypothetical protein
MARGIGELEQALALDPNLAIAHAWIGGAKYYVGRGSETETHIRESLRLSPLKFSVQLSVTRFLFDTQPLFHSRKSLIVLALTYRSIG